MTTRTNDRENGGERSEDGQNRDRDRDQETIDLGDTVRLKKPYGTIEGKSQLDRLGSTYTHGIVVEIVTHQRGPDSPPRSASLHLFNPRTRSLYVHSQGPGAYAMAEHVDFPIDNLVLVHKASEGYRMRDLDSPTTRSETPPAEGLIPDERALFAQIEPLLSELEERGLVSSIVVRNKNVATPPEVIVSGDPPGGPVGLAMDVAERIGFTVSCGPIDEGIGTPQTLTSLNRLSGTDTAGRNASRRGVEDCDSRYYYTLSIPDYDSAYADAEGCPFR